MIGYVGVVRVRGEKFVGVGGGRCCGNFGEENIGCWEFCREKWRQD